MTYADKASYESSLLCMLVLLVAHNSNVQEDIVITKWKSRILGVQGGEDS